MNAFAYNPSGTLFKVYRKDDDWQVCGDRVERWFSVWRQDEKASLLRALASIPGGLASFEIVSLNQA